MKVDVFDGSGKRVHTYEIALSGINYTPLDDEYIQRAKRFACDDRLVPDSELDKVIFRLRRNT